jgi:hypothetical protein
LWRDEWILLGKMIVSLKPESVDHPARDHVALIPKVKSRKADPRLLASMMMLAAEANGVVALRMMKLMRGGKSARSEADLMVREKIDAALEATSQLMAGGSGEKIVRGYRKRVAANAKRLRKSKSLRSSKRRPRSK